MLDSPRLLILHHNFPAQFVHILRYRESKALKTVFIYDSEAIIDFESFSHTIVIKASFKPKKNSRGHQKQFDRALNYQHHFLSLREEGFNPDVTLSHDGWGCGVFVKDIFPSTFFVCYNEWWFSHKSFKNVSIDPENKWLPYDIESSSLSILRNSTTGIELVNSDAIICPTNFQKNQLPPKLQEKAVTVYEPILAAEYISASSLSDLSRSNNTLHNGKIYLTYATRGLEPMRCFPLFVSLLEDLLPNIPMNARVLIAGSDTVNYGGKKPPNSTFKAWAEDRLEPYTSRGIVKFVGKLPFESYLKLLQRSSLHFYLSRAFVPSWSLLDALYLGAPLLCSNIEPVRELTDSSDVSLVQNSDLPTCKEMILSLLQSNSSLTSLREKRGHLLSRHCKKKYLNTLNQLL